MATLGLELGIRIVVFGLVFWVVAPARNPRIGITPRWALPLVALVFGVANVTLYWLLKSAVVLASLWTLSLLAPLIANAALVYATERVVKPLRIDGLVPMLWLSLALTGAHLALHVAFGAIAA